MSAAGSLVLIPARAGSKRLRDKMLRKLGAKTLVQWAVESVLASGCFERIVVSSDSEAILECVVAVRGVEARLRPAELATDTATNMAVLTDLLETPERHPLHDRSTAVAAAAPTPASIVALCQPTTPFRTAEDIRQTVALLRPGYDSAIAVMAAPIPPQRSFPMSDAAECLIAADSPLVLGRTRHQAYPDTYTPNGAVYVSSRAHVLEHRSFFVGRVAGNVMPRERSLDIDDEFDWQLAEFLLRSTQDQ